MSALSLLYGALVVAMWLFGGVPIQGWTSLMVVLLGVSGVQLLVTGIFGEYLWRNLEATRRRPRFVIDRVLEPPGAGAGDGTDSRAA